MAKEINWHVTAQKFLQIGEKNLENTGLSAITELYNDHAIH